MPIELVERIHRREVHPGELAFYAEHAEQQLALQTAKMRCYREKEDPDAVDLRISNVWGYDPEWMFQQFVEKYGPHPWLYYDVEKDNKPRTYAPGAFPEGYLLLKLIV
jgi:hypothetical protein